MMTRNASTPGHSPEVSEQRPVVEVVQYSQIDDTVYLRWRENGEATSMAAIPRLEAMDEDPTPLCNRLRRLGLGLDPGDDEDLAERVRGECCRRFPALP